MISKTCYHKAMAPSPWIYTPSRSGVYGLSSWIVHFFLPHSDTTMVVLGLNPQALRVGNVHFLLYRGWMLQHKEYNSSETVLLNGSSIQSWGKAMWMAIKLPKQQVEMRLLIDDPRSISDLSHGRHPFMLRSVTLRKRRDHHHCILSKSLALLTYNLKLKIVFGLCH